MTKVATIYIDKNLGALWGNQQISVEMAECLLNQYQVLGYRISNRENSGLYILVKEES